MATRSIIQHLHLPALTPYLTATALQESLARQFLDHKSSPSSAALPPPTIITFTPPPVYTIGRRENESEYPSDILSKLKQPLPDGPYMSDGKGGEVPMVPEFVKATRGGLITFHGPGQVVIYPTFSLDKPSSFQEKITPRCYVSLLEATTISLLKKFGIEGFRTKDPGVWVNSKTGSVKNEGQSAPMLKPLPEDEKTEEKKIAALGVHLRRNVTSYGVGLNVSTDLRWFDRITACGIEGKGVTSISKEAGVGFGTVEEEMRGNKVVAESWVLEFAREVKAEVVQVTEGQILEQLGFAKWVPKEEK